MGKLLLKFERPAENWGTYLTNIRSKPASILVDLSLRTIAPLTSHPQLFVVRVEMQNPREDGFYQNEEREILYAIEDAIVAAVSTLQTQGLHVGKLTHDGTISYYFYYPEQVILKRVGLSPDSQITRSTPVALEQFVDQVMTRFKEYKYQCTGSSEPGWEAYINLLYPDEWEMHLVTNGQLLANMQARNDNTAVARPIDHFILCPTAEAQMKIMSSAKSLGFVATARAINQNGLYGLELVRTDVPDKIDEIMWPLFKWAKENNAVYDGWGSVPVNQ